MIVIHPSWKIRLSVAVAMTIVSGALWLLGALAQFGTSEYMPEIEIVLKAKTKQEEVRMCEAGKTVTDRLAPS